MAYTNAIFYIDFVNGSDTARTTFAPTAYANNGSGAVRVTKTAHGLITGAIIDITGSGVAGYNQAWKITRIDADNFDLDTSTYSSNPATKGTVAPRGGSSWSDAWLTISSGATSLKHQVGDTIRIAKSSDPTSIGNATWTSLSSTVTLASSQTLTLDNCETAWTGVNSSTSGTDANRKQGSLSVRITMPSTGTATNTRYAYKTFGSTQDLSSYNAITFWYRPNALANNSTTWTLKLCSDTLGVTEVDRFDFPPNNSASQWVPLTLTRVGGGNLGNNIQSIALYTGSTGSFNNNFILLDNISACSNTGLSLTSMISKNSAAFGGLDTWHNLQSLDGTTLILGSNQSVNANGTLKGYYTTGTSPETVTTYARPTIRFNPGSSNGAINLSGTAGNVITYTGGWDTTSNTQNGETWLDGVAENNYFFTNWTNYSYLKFERFGMVRWTSPFANASGSTNANIDIQMIVVGCSTAMIDMFQNSSLSLVTNNCLDGPTALTSGSSVSKNNTYTSLISYNHNNSAGSIQTNSSYFPSIKIANCNGIFRMNCIGEISIDFLSMYRCGNTGLTLDSNANTSPVCSSSYSVKELEYVNNNTGSNTGIIAGNAKIQKFTVSGNTGSNGAMYNVQVLQTNATSSVLPTQITPSGYNTFQPAYSFNSVNNVTTDNRIYWSLGNALSQTTTRHSASGIAWQVNITNTAQTSSFPANIPIARIACNSGTAVTVKAWVLKSHATNIAAGLFIKALEIPGITSDIKTTKSNDTNWEELTISFTPTVAGVVQIYLQAWWVASTANQSVYVDDITVTQA